MEETFRNRKLWIARSSIFKTQSAWDVPLADADINTLLRQNTPAFPDIRETFEDDLDCSTEYAFARQLTSRLWEFSLGFNGSVAEMAGWLALCLGQDTLTGAQVNEVQTISSTATGGTFKLITVIDGETFTTAPIAFNATAATIKAALEAVLGVGNILTATGGPLPANVVITFGGDLANFNVGAMTVDNTGATGGTVTVALTTPGSNFTHSLTTNGTSDQTPQTSFIYGFEGATANPVKAKNIIGSSWKVSGNTREKVLCEVKLFGSADVAEVIGFIKPPCVNDPHLRVADTRLKIGGTYYQFNSFSLEFNNNTFTGDDPFTADSFDATRLERGDRKTTLNISAFGSRGGALANVIESNTEWTSELVLGKPAERLRCLAPAMHLQKASPFITFSGEANRSTISADGEAFVSGDAGSPFNAVALINQSTAFLTT